MTTEYFKPTSNLKRIAQAIGGQSSLNPESGEQADGIPDAEPAGGSEIPYSPKADTTEKSFQIPIRGLLWVLATNKDAAFEKAEAITDALSILESLPGDSDTSDDAESTSWLELLPDKAGITTQGD